MPVLIYTTLIFLGFIAVETVFIALSTGYLFIQVKSPLLEQAAFYWTLAREDLLTTLQFVLIDKPVFIIQSQHESTGSVIWSLHYFSLSLLVHLGLAYILAYMRIRFGPRIKYEALPLAGSLLLVVCSLYLFLGSCCSGGPNWIVQTWMLAVVFNPVTSTNGMIKFYQAIKDGFVVLQIVGGVTGAYLLVLHHRKMLATKH